MSITATVLDFDTRSATGEGTWAAQPKFLVGISDRPETIKDREPVERFMGRASRGTLASVLEPYTGGGQ